MKLTKYAHACVVLQDRDRKLVIDPGGFTPEFGSLDNIVGVVVTHVHPDHFNPRHLQAIFSANPNVPLYTTAEVAAEFKAPNVHLASPGEQVAIGPFMVRFGGDLHAFIHQSLPQPHNISVFVNDTFYYPGDSYTMPDKPVTMLAVPANAPWMKAAESMDYIASVKPKRCFPTHNGLLSDNGHKVYNAGLNGACQANGVAFLPLAPGESVEV